MFNVIFTLCNIYTGFIGGQSRQHGQMDQCRWNIFFHALEHIFRRAGSYVVITSPSVYLPHFSYFEKLSFSIQPLKISLSLEYDILQKAINNGIWHVDTPSNIEQLSDFVWRLTGGSNVLTTRAIAFLVKTIVALRNKWSELEDDEDINPNDLSMDEFYEHFFPGCDSNTTNTLTFATNDLLDVSDKLKELLPTDQVKRMLPTDFWPSGHDVTARGRRASVRQAKFLANPSTTASSRLPGSMPKSPLAARKLLFGVAEPQAVITRACIYDDIELDAERPPDRHIHEEVLDIMNKQESSSEDEYEQVGEQARPSKQVVNAAHLFFESSDSDDDGFGGAIDNGMDF